MTYCAFSLLLGFLVIPVTSAFPPGSCDGYTNITEPWRNLDFTSFFQYPTDDRNLLNNWWRFTGIGGDRVITGCVAPYRGGTWYTAYIPFTYPTNESVTPTTGTAYGYLFGCGSILLTVSVALCPGGFYVYKPLSHPIVFTGYVTYHYQCKPNSCGPSALCTPGGGCICIPGFEIPSGYIPTPESYGCVDVDECQRTPRICGPYAACTNTIGSYTCAYLGGFSITDSTLPPGSFNQSIVTVPSSNINGSFNSAICGLHSVFTNMTGAYSCACQLGYTPTQPNKEPSKTNICIDVNECVENATICGPNSVCTNSIGSYSCTCLRGYQLNKTDVIASVANPCTDIDECSETPGICGKQAVCTNVLGTFYCSCPDGLYPSTGVLWEIGISFCQTLEDVLRTIVPPKGKTKLRAFLDYLDQQLQNNTHFVLPETTVATLLSTLMAVSGVSPQAGPITVSSEGDGETGTLILEISDRIVSAMVSPTDTQTTKTLQTSTVDLSLLATGPGDNDSGSVLLFAKGNIMEINLHALARANNGSAAVAFMILNGMESLLSHQYFITENKTEMYSDILTAMLFSVKNTYLTNPVNFTIQHKKVPESGIVTCVYWEDNSKNNKEGEQNAMRWSAEGCWIEYSSENYTVCSCSHLSTFALIMQIGEPPPENPFVTWLNRVCVIIGLFFFALAILTFLLCSWNPKINNTARLHLCLNLALFQLLLLCNDTYVNQKLACKAMAGLIHFLVVASFVWMLLEALQLHLLVQRLSKVQVIRRDGLPRPVLYLIGYGVPFVIVGISALVYSDGYGATDEKTCWLSRERNFNWALTGPVVVTLGLNWILFCATLWSLRPTLATMKSDVSQSKDTRLIVFKILAQFVILGCTWIIGLYQTNLFFQILFIVLNSQQGTFLYIVHCLLNKEVREEYIRWLRYCFGKDRAEKDALSVSENMDKPEDQTDEKTDGRKNHDEQS